ncbi:MAG: hypothetical protein BWY17_01808 [Deltaproteobacteria bacterium ADurb.Bin207]|nr:MAG: hypothetical protein BWY17_01808 [Deltaproteobacteria bacterium ADurb.Bin207]
MPFRPPASDRASLDDFDKRPFEDPNRIRVRNARSRNGVPLLDAIDLPTPQDPNRCQRLVLTMESNRLRRNDSGRARPIAPAVPVPLVWLRETTFVPTWRDAEAEKEATQTTWDFVIQIPCRPTLRLYAANLGFRMPLPLIAASQRPHIQPDATAVNRSSAQNDSLHFA